MIRKATTGFSVLLAVATVLAWTPRARAVDGIVITVRYEKEGMGDIHDSRAPGRLMRYDLKDDRVVARRVLCSETSAACIGPFGRRVAFTRPDGTIAIVGIDGGEPTDLGSFLGGEKSAKPVSTGLQWPAGEGGRWVYYMDGRNGGGNNALRRVNAETKADEEVVRFNRNAGGGFALSRDATGRSGKYVVRTDNYTLAAYDLAAGDGDLYAVPQFAPGCGNSVSPDGALFTANSGWHTLVVLVDMNGRRQGEFRVNQYDGDPTAGVTDRKEIEWAWQHHRWSVNAMDWIAITQGRLRKGEPNYQVYFTDAVLYDWVHGRQINVTRNAPGQFDRAGGFWQNGVSDRFLGFHRGEAPLTVELSDERLRGDWRWDFGDGAPPATGPAGRHTFAKAGLYTVRAVRDGQTFRAQVNVQKRRPPRAACHYLGPTRLLVVFDEPVRPAGADAVSARLDGGVKVASTRLDASGRQLAVQLAEPLERDDFLRVAGLVDLAQVPNAPADEPLAVRVPAWPASRRDLVFLWEDGRSLNAVYDEQADRVRRLHVTIDRGSAGLDRYRRMRLQDGLMDTGFFSQGGAKMDFGPLIKADAFTLELTLESADLRQDRGEFPARIVNCSAWYDWDWEFMLGQKADRLLFSIRTTDNYLSKDGKPIQGGLHGRAPIHEIARLPDTRPHHLVVSYVPGRLAAWLDGRAVFQTDQVTGSLMKWGYGELCFGDSHNGGRHGWLGRLEGVAIYKRLLDADEVRRNHEAYWKKVASRVTLPQITIEAKLLAASKTPDAARIAPYRDALIVNEYEVARIVGATKGWKFGQPIAPGTKVRVAQWGLIDARQTIAARLKPGDGRRMALETYTAHPEKLDEQVTSDTLPEDLDAPLLYEPEPE